MNKWHIICPLAAVAVAAAVAFQVVRVSANRETMDREVYQIGRELIATTNSSRLVRVGPVLARRLSAFLSLPSRVVEVRRGDDLPPQEVRPASRRLILSNSRGERLSIRLRQDFAPGKFEVVGFRDITE